MATRQLNPVGALLFDGDERSLAEVGQVETSSREQSDKPAW